MQRGTGRIRSLKTMAMRLWVILTGALLLVFFLYALFLTRSSREETWRINRILADHYAGSLGKDIGRMADTMDEMFANNTFYQRLVRYQLDDFDWVDSAWHIQTALREYSAALDFAGGHFYYDGERHSMRSAFSEEVTDARFNDTLRDWLHSLRDERQYHGFLRDGTDVWLVNFKGIKGKLLGYAVNLSRYVQDDSREAVAYIDEEEGLVCLMGQDMPGDMPEQLLAAEGQKTVGRYLLTASPVAKAGMELALVSRAVGLEELLARPDELLLLLLLPLITLLTLIYLYRYNNYALLAPVRHILFRIGQMKEEAGDELLSREKTVETITEYREINEKIDEMLAEIRQLTMEKQQEELNARSALLQYYQLQVDPHFYLNCLNSISSLLQNRSPEVANDMIMALSAHFRYVFQKSRSLVPLTDELRELKNYCSIYSIKGGIPILLSVEAKDEVMDVRVPILVLQTFVENAIKHVSGKGRVLSLKVRAYFREGGSRDLILWISDNGPGFPADMLPQLNEPFAGFDFAAEHVGILNLKYRCRLLYGGKEHFVFFNAPGGGAVVEILLPEEKGEYTDH